MLQGCKMDIQAQNKTLTASTDLNKRPLWPLRYRYPITENTYLVKKKKKSIMNTCKLEPTCFRRKFHERLIRRFLLFDYNDNFLYLF